MATYADSNGNAKVNAEDMMPIAINWMPSHSPKQPAPHQLAKAALVRINIYDVSGSLVRSLEIGQQPDGDYFSEEKATYWDGRNHIGERVPSGVYFHQLQAGNLF
jgi:hypothetical protein